MPTAAQREGDVSPTVTIPKSLISPQAQALLNLYPLPNSTGSGAYNYQIPLVGVTHQDSLQSRWNKSIDRKNQVFGNFAFQDTRQDNPNVFGFLDTTDSFGLTTSANWFHRFAQGLFGTFSYQFSRLSTGPHSVLRKSRERFGRGRHCRQRSKSLGLGTAESKLCQRHPRALGFGAGHQPQ